jgi:thioester reductase-like protein
MAVFALPRRIPIHYISSNRVTLQGPDFNDAALPPVSVAEHEPARDGSEGFTAAKWVGEVFLEKLARASSQDSGRLLPVTIHRPCAVVGEDAPLEDALNALLRYSRVMNTVPHVISLNVQGYFDFRDVNDAADEIADSIVSSHTNFSLHESQSQAARFIYHCSGVKVLPADFRQYMEKFHGGAFKELPLDEWIESAQKQGLEELIVTYLRAVVGRGETLVFPYMGTEL